MRDESPLFPLFADLRARVVLVVGGGAVATRKVRALLRAGAWVRVGAPELEAELHALAERGELCWSRGRFEAEWLDQPLHGQLICLVVAATDDSAINQAVSEAATARRLFVNVVDDARRSSIQLPAVVERGPLQIAISSGGHAPMLARHLRRLLEERLDSSWTELARLLARQRGAIRARLVDPAARRAFFDRLLTGPLRSLLRRRRHKAAEALLLQQLDGAPMPSKGRVTVVGAGSGDPGLLTLNALRALNQAEVILHDRLVSAEVLSLARRDAQRIEVGKSGRGPSTAQDRIHALMLEHARAGRHVVRLKGGDAFIFGRGGEELEFLRAHAVSFEVVPGITAALACAAYAGIPLTHREHAQELRLITAHTRSAIEELDWLALARPRQTLVFYMGVTTHRRVRKRLLANGLATTTPVALIENGSRPEQRVLRGTLDQLDALVEAHQLQAPALLVVGAVAALADELHWFGRPPLRFETCGEEVAAA